MQGCIDIRLINREKESPGCRIRVLACRLGQRDRPKPRTVITTVAALSLAVESPQPSLFTLTPELQPFLFVHRHHGLSSPMPFLSFSSVS